MAEQPGAQLRRAGQGVVLPQELLDLVEPGELGRHGDRVLPATVDRGVQAAPDLGHRLDPLVVDAGLRVEQLGLGHLAGVDRRAERLGAGDQAGHVLVDVAGVSGHGRGELGLGRPGRPGGPSGDGDGPVRPGRPRAADLVAAGLDVEGEGAGQPRREVLLLTEDVGQVGGAQLGFGDGAGAGVGHVERDLAGADPGGLGRAALRREVDRHRAGPARAGTAAGGVRARASGGGQREQGEDGRPGPPAVATLVTLLALDTHDRNPPSARPAAQCHRPGGRPASRAPGGRARSPARPSAPGRRARR